MTDSLHIYSDQANARGADYLKKQDKLRRWVLQAALARLNLLVFKRDRKTIAERREARENGEDWPPLAETMIGLKRLENLQLLIRTIIDERVPGDLIETGVWRGGACIFMRGVLKAYGVTDRAVWVCDSFEGLPLPNINKYPEDEGDKHHTFNFLSVSEEEVRENFRRYNMLDDQVHFVRGYFEDTLTDIPAREFSLVRLDGDMYGSTMTALESLYGRLVPNGFIIVDDFGLPPCQKAVEHFRKRNDIRERIVEIDRAAVYWRKSTA